MNTLLLCFISALFSISQTDVSLTTKTYMFEHLSGNNKKLTDYIQLTFKDGSAVKGTYYGNEDDYHFVSDIEFDINNENISFSLAEYRFCNENSSPFHKTEYHEVKVLPFPLEGSIHFRGTFSSGQLKLERTFWHYDNRLDKMLFKLVKEE